VPTCCKYRASTFDANSNFFALGGDSLSAMRTVARINTALKAPLSLASLFANPTIVALAALSVAPPQQLSVPIRRVALDSHAGVVCSYGQERLFFLNRMYPTDSEYHMPSTYVLRGALDVVRLQAALNIVVDRHEVLRTTYRIVNDTVRQFVHNIAPVHLQVEDVRATLTLTDVVGAEATRNASIPFDLANGPILRARLLLVEHNVHVLLLNIHHIARRRRVVSRH
jgi:pristinamycin I synthase-3/4